MCYTYYEMEHKTNIGGLSMAEHLTFRLKDSDKVTKKLLDKQANNLGWNRTDLVLYALNFIQEVDPVLIKRIEKIANDVNIPGPIVIQNFVINILAREAAKMELNNELGLPYIIDPEFAESFMKSNKDKPITGEELFNIFKYKYRREFNEELIDSIKDRPVETLREEEKNLLIKYRTGRAWRESEQYKKDLEKKEIMKELEELNEKAVNGELTEKEEKKLDLLLLKLKNFE
jgi:hypothetical protein